MRSQRGNQSLTIFVGAHDDRAAIETALACPAPDQRAQEQASAAFDGMPQSAIDADVVDFILAPEEIPLQLAKLTSTYNNGLIADRVEGQLSDEDAFRHLNGWITIRVGSDDHTAADYTLAGPDEVHQFLIWLNRNRR